MNRRGVIKMVEKTVMKLYFEDDKVCAILFFDDEEVARIQAVQKPDVLINIEYMAKCLYLKI